MGIILNGKYYPDKSAKDITHSNSNISDLHTEHKLSAQAKAHAHNLIQPNNPDGSPNQDFIDYYPEDAKAHGFIKDNSNQEINKDESK